MDAEQLREMVAKAGFQQIVKHQDGSSTVLPDELFARFAALVLASHGSQRAAEGDDMLEPLIYAAIMHNGKPKTIGDFVKAAANVVDMLKRREASQTQPKWMWTDGQIEAVRPGPCEPAAFAAGFRYGYSAVASAAAPAHANGLWTVISPGGKVFIGESAHRAANEANKHLRATDPDEVKRWADMLDRLRAENELENERLLAEHGTLNCPACGGSGHIGDVSEPPGAGPEVPAGMALVPIEPTPEMLDAYVQSGNGKTLTGCELDAVRASGRDDWAAMLAATPTVQAPAPAHAPGHVAWVVRKPGGYCEVGYQSSVLNKLEHGTLLYTAPQRGSFMTREQAIAHCRNRRPGVEPTEQHIAATIDAYSALFGELTPAETASPAVAHHARQSLPPQSPVPLTDADLKTFRLGWLECEAAHGIGVSHPPVQGSGQ